jgi:glucose/arabinose dehydrogenase
MAVAVRVATVALVGALTAACTGGDGVPRTASTTRPGAASPSMSPGLSTAQEVATGLHTPWGLAILPCGDALVGERDRGRVLRIPASGGQPEEVYRIPAAVAGGEGGLLGLALSPHYDHDRYVYAYLTSTADNRIIRFRLGDSAAPELVFAGLARADVHNGGRIAFGPDGMLYVGTGDAGRQGVSQDPASPNGKILRLTPDGRPAPGNPIAGSPVYSSGHRNVQGLAWDDADRMYAIEFGQDRHDEVNLIRPGGNYGWPEVEGVGDPASGPFVNPLVTWTTDEASPSGAAVAGGTLYVAALMGERLWAVPLRDGQPGTPTSHLNGRYGRLRTVVAAPDGALWLTTSNTDGYGEPRDGDDRLLRIPAPVTAA